MYSQPRQDLTQIASQAPRFLGEFAKTKQQPNSALSVDPVEDLFDFPLYFADAPARNRSDASSTPDLTIGTSEEGGTPPLRPVDENPNPKTAIKQVKQQDDRNIWPAREIKSKDDLLYPPHLQLDNASPPTSPGIPEYHTQIGDNATLMPFGRITMPSGQSPSRGKRDGPLKNREHVADVRKIGACARCKARRVKCDNKVTCAGCVKDAEKYGKGNCTTLAENLCFRTPFRGISPRHSAPFRVIYNKRTETKQSGTNCQNNPEAHQAEYKFEIWFECNPEGSRSLPLSVNKITANNTTYWALAKHRAPDAATLVEWASSQLWNQSGQGYQEALDRLIRDCPRGPSSPYFDIVTGVSQMRYLYKIWRHPQFYVRIDHDTKIVPDSIRQELKDVANAFMKQIETEVLDALKKVFESGRKPGCQEQLPLWASLMGLILLYRDVHGQVGLQEQSQEAKQVQQVVANLFDSLVVWLHFYFGKKKPESLDTCFKITEGQLEAFYRSIREGSSGLDQLFVDLVVGHSNAGGRPVKRPRNF
ncbi:hypothetical protein F4778DRAFT_432458 [Xylariomycetidae sp. FL2044]|nr:hypothetical protein F4778DRAFT_432458 [Xylariomycetidae sp. FL2044]